MGRAAQCDTEALVRGPSQLPRRAPGMADVRLRSVRARQGRRAEPGVDGDRKMEGKA